MNPQLIGCVVAVVLWIGAFKLFKRARGQKRSVRLPEFMSESGRARLPLGLRNQDPEHPYFGPARWNGSR